MTTPSNTPGAVQNLRDALDEAGLEWMPVRGYPEGTYVFDLKDAQMPGHTIWWQGPTSLHYLWGHSFEHHDPTPEAVITKLKETSNA